MSSMANITADERQIYDQLYDRDLFLDEISEEFKCAICLSIVRDAQQLPCDHLFCRQCITTYFQSIPASNYCPIDRSPTTAADIRPAPRSVTNTIAKLQTRCWNYRDGCTTRMPLDQLDRHAVICRFGPCGPSACDTTSAASTAADTRDVVGVEVSALPMTIYVKLADGSKTAVINATVEDNVLTLKRRIQEKEGINPQSMVLIHGSKPLDDRKLLVEYNIRNGSVVFSTRRFEGGFVALLFIH